MSRVALVLLVVAACKHDGPVPDKLGAPEPQATTAPAPRPVPASLTRVTIKALGMYCEESCPLKVRTALAEVPAVYELGFDLSNESIFVSYDASLGTPKDVTKPMIAAIKSAGFDPWLAKETWPDGAEAQVVTR
jgi:copper chaperone CopZ